MLPPDQQNLDKVDMLSGCSIGAILVAAYAAGRSFTEVDEQFQKRAADCFDKRFMARISPLACPTYDSDSLDEVLRDMIGDELIRDVRDRYPYLDILMPALNLTDDSYKVYDNITPQDGNIFLRDAAADSAAAPSYYKGRDRNGKCMVDGGLIEVAPLLTTTTALKAKRGVEFCDMDVLMLGTGRDVDDTPMTTKRYNGLTLLGLATDVIVPYVTLSNEMATRYWGKNIGYHSFNYFNPCVTNGELDDVSKIPGMIEQAEQYRQEFLAAWDAWMNA
jgi:patatin-like phospholipase/acyl hydrolase